MELNALALKLYLIITENSALYILPPAVLTIQIQFLQFIFSLLRRTLGTLPLIYLLIRMQDKRQRWSLAVKWCEVAAVCCRVPYYNSHKACTNWRWTRSLIWFNTVNKPVLYQHVFLSFGPLCYVQVQHELHSSLKREFFFI